MAIKWLSKEHGNDTALDLCARLPADGPDERSAVALSHIKKGEVLLRVPRRTCTIEGAGDAVAARLAELLAADDAAWAPCRRCVA